MEMSFFRFHVIIIYVTFRAFAAARRIYLHVDGHANFVSRMRREKWSQMLFNYIYRAELRSAARFIDFFPETFDTKVRWYLIGTL